MTIPELPGPAAGETRGGGSRRLLAALWVALPLIVLALMTMGLIASVYALWAGHREAPAVAAAVAGYGLGVSGLLLLTLRLYHQHRDNSHEIRKQNAIIALLLNDFSADSGDWLWETDAAGRLVYVSRHLPAKLGRSTAELIGKPLREAVGAGRSDARWQDLEAAMNAGNPVDGQIVGLLASGRESWWRITARPIRGGDGSLAGYQGAAHDVTAARRTEVDLIAAKEAAERASARKSQYIQAMSHELRTPLNAIIGFSELLCSPPGETLGEETRADYLRIIAESGRRLQALIKGIIETTRLDRDTLRLVEQEVDAAELAEVAVKLCREAAEAGDVTIVAHVIDAVEVTVDVARIKQVLVGMVAAAVKASPVGGRVEMRLERMPGNALAFAVAADSGAFGRQNIDEAFDPILQAEQGALDDTASVAERIVTLHGGTLSIAALRPRGVEARLTLPASRVNWPASAGG